MVERVYRDQRGIWQDEAGGLLTQAESEIADAVERETLSVLGFEGTVAEARERLGQWAKRLYELVGVHEEDPPRHYPFDEFRLSKEGKDWLARQQT